ncbi:NERD domain-containing protein [Mammaliicoccus sciuri]|uniref:NERD domain-containing protein n=1 Tax=Mammaliicoccus sciuri TaxID=1296 RepID=UPI00194EA607|nr:NERD domain-containing protein [Mammaliicoccus sciuri]MCD8824082.1 NERD domain-containing protein [Mammaliicoccus sciuri]
MVNTYSEESIKFLKEENERLRKENEALKSVINVPGNRGEKITAQHLDEIMENLKSNQYIDNHQIFHNLVILDNKHGNNRQIDHLVITNKCIFIIETKHWKGDIYYNFNEENLKKCNLFGLKKYLFDSEKKSYKTFVLDSNEENLLFNSYGHPFIQVMHSAMLIQESIGFKFVNPIIYFNYQNGGQVYIGNEDGFVGCVTSKKLLKEYIIDKISNPVSKINLTTEEFNNYCSKIESLK